MAFLVTGSSPSCGARPSSRDEGTSFNFVAKEAVTATALLMHPHQPSAGTTVKAAALTRPRFRPLPMQPPWFGVPGWLTTQSPLLPLGHESFYRQRRTTSGSGLLIYIKELRALA